MHRGYLIFSVAVIAMETLEIKGTVGRRWKGRNKEAEVKKKEGMQQAISFKTLRIWLLFWFRNSVLFGKHSLLDLKYGSVWSMHLKIRIISPFIWNTENKSTKTTLWFMSFLMFSWLYDSDNGRDLQLRCITLGWMLLFALISFLHVLDHCPKSLEKKKLCSWQGAEMLLKSGFLNVFLSGAFIIILFLDAWI